MQGDAAQSQLEQFLYLIHQGPLEETPWQSFLRALRLHLECDAVALSLRSTQPGRIASVYYEHDGYFDVTPLDDPQIVRTMLKMKHPLRNALRRSGDIFTSDDVMPREQFVQTEFYREVLSRMGVEHELGMAFDEPGGWSASLGLMNGPERQCFGDSEKKLMRRFLPHLQQALEIYGRIKRSETEGFALKAALNRLDIGTFLLNGLGKVIDINDVGRTILRRSKAIRLRRNQLTFDNLQDNQRFQAAIADALKSRLGSAAPAELALRIEDHAGGVFGLLVSAIPPSDLFEHDSMPCLTVFVRDGACRQSAPEHLVSQLFGLVPSEARLVTLLVDGYTLVEAAEKLCLTETSVRTYASRIFGKIGISRQAELTQKVLNSVAPLGSLRQQ